MEGDNLIEFEEKPAISDTWINGGYFFFRREFIDYLDEDDGCVLERTPLSRLARDGELQVYRHAGFWKSMDTQRDRDELNAVWRAGDAPWLPTVHAS
jgi:glucose-1-phosphate cytidylyltransferase